jgi:D-arabinan exo alpha-(1,3)/(1,5)-arabinofuranosidase (non-reducing end)
MWGDPSIIDLGLESRAVSFENPTGAGGAGGTAHKGRKGAPKKIFKAGETVVLADLEGPGTLRHFWMTIPLMQPELMRGVRLEVFYDGSTEPSVSVPALDFFGSPLGRPTAFASSLCAVQEGRGFNAYYPMPFNKKVRVELTNETNLQFSLYYQIDYTLEKERKADQGYLHVTFRRENPTVRKRDFVIEDGLKGPGRFLGCVVGIRVLQDNVFAWYGEGELKMFIDGDDELPTICGTGLEDYVGTAWGMGVHETPYQGVQFDISDPEAPRPMPDFTSFYRWHVPDPVIFKNDLKVTIQQIGAVYVQKGKEGKRERIEQDYGLAGPGWQGSRGTEIVDWGIAERVDDYCAASFVYCKSAQAVPRYDAALATQDIERLHYEKPSGMEARLAAVGASVSEGT